MEQVEGGWLILAIAIACCFLAHDYAQPESSWRRWNRNAGRPCCAPVDGVVTLGDVQVGDILEPGKPVMEIAERKGFLFELVVPSEVGHIQLAMPARIKLDAYDYQRYGAGKAKIAYITPDSGLIEDRPTPSYLVRLTVEGDHVGRGDLQGRVKLGMAGLAEIVTDRQSLLSLLVRKIRQTISLG